MATSKTLTPTNVTISIPAMTDSPDASVFSNCVDKEADAINSLNSKISKIKTEDVYASSESNWDTAIENYSDSLPNDGMLHIGFVQRSGAGMCVCIVQKINDGNYASVLSFGYWRGPYYYSKNNGVWAARKITLDT